MAVLAPRLAPTVAWSTALYGVYTYLGAGLTSAGFSTAETASVIVFYGCGAIAGVLIGGRLADRFGARLTGAFALGGLGLCILLLRLALDSAALVDFAFAAAHGGIRRHPLAAAHEQQVALAQIGNRHFVDSSPARSESCAIDCPE